MCIRDSIYTVNVTSAGNGSVAVDPPGTQFTAGTQITLTATPDEGFYFDGWRGDLISGSNPHLLTVDGNKNIVAHFSDRPPVPVSYTHLDYTDLLPGANQVVITALDTALVSSQAVVTVNYAAAPAWTPQTYTVNWGAASNVSDVAQVIDGEWTIDNGTARPTIMEFDRLLGIGDLSWRDYTVTVPITIAPPMYLSLIHI